jgi:hypothetical protein
MADGQDRVVSELRSIRQAIYIVTFIVVLAMVWRAL